MTRSRDRPTRAGTCTPYPAAANASCATCHGSTAVFTGGWIGSPVGWAAISLARTDDFKPTDLALLPDGDVLLLERRYSLIGGPAARLAIMPAAEIRPGARLTGQPIAELTLPLSVDNFEARAAAPAPGGGTRLDLLSDGHRHVLQRTLLLQFLLRP